MKIGLCQRLVLNIPTASTIIKWQKDFTNFGLEGLQPKLLLLPFPFRHPPFDCFVPRNDRAWGKKTK